MPRKARAKSEECIYHVICRSVSEFLLFRDDQDKVYYLQLLKRYVDKYKCRIYAYCLMDNHLHIHFDPRGFDISRFMHSTNVAYVRYYNKKYDRHGPVFQERFESRILDSDEYNVTVSAYIHNNAKDIEGYCGREEEYPYSSYGIYVGKRKDHLGLIDKSFIMSLFNISDQRRFEKKYWEFACYHRDMGNTLKNTSKLSSAIEYEYRGDRKVISRNWNPSKVVAYISDKLMVSKSSGLMIKTKKRLLEYRAICAYAMRVLCGLRFREICENMYNITVSACSKLCDKGYLLIQGNSVYDKIINDLIVMELT